MGVGIRVLDIERCCTRATALAGRNVESRYIGRFDGEACSFGDQRGEPSGWESSMSKSESSICIRDAARR